MSQPSDMDAIGEAMGGTEVSRHQIRVSESEEPCSWATIFAPPRRSKVDLVITCAGTPDHEWIVLLPTPADDELFGAVMAQAIVRSPIEHLRSGHVVVAPELWLASSPNNHLPYRYRLSPAPGDIRARYEHCAMANGYGPPAYLAEPIAAVERVLVRLARLIELDAPEAMIHADIRKAAEGLEKLREFADDSAIVEVFAEPLRPLAAEILSSDP